MTRLDRLTIRSGATIRDAMAAIEAGGAEVCLVVDADGRLTGLVTDGDIRRALLGGRTMASAVSECLNPKFHAVTDAAGRAEVLDLMLARGFSQVPVLDKDQRLVGLHLLRELVGSEVRPNHAVIMAGGQGVRLRPLTEQLPKPMIPIAGRPILERLVLHLISFGIRHIHLAINYKGDLIERHFGDGARFGCRIDYLREALPLGTAGAITLLAEPPQHPLIVMNGDLVTQVNIERLLAAHTAATASVTVGVREYRLTLPYGVIDASPDGRAAAIREKPTEIFLINAGVYVVSPGSWALLERGTAVAMTDLIARCIERNDPPGLFVVDEDWVDVGRHEDLQHARGLFAPS